MYKVLIVDDEPFIREGLKKLVDWNSLGFEVCGEAEDGTDAFELIQKYHPNLVITDIRMVEMNGLDLIKIIRDNDAFDDVRFILLSAYGEFEYAKEAMKYGVRYYILKPINYEELAKNVRKIYKDIIEEEIDYDIVIKSNLMKIIHGDIDKKLIQTLEKNMEIYKNNDLRYLTIYCNMLYNTQILEYLTKKNIFCNVEDKNSINFILSDKNCKIYKIESVQLFLKDVIIDLSKIINGEYFVLCGEKVNGLINIKKSYDTIKIINEYRFYNGNENLIIFENIKNIHFNSINETTQYFEDLIQYIEVSNYEIIESEIEKLFRDFRSFLVKPEYIQVLIYSFQLNLLSNIGKKNIENTMYISEEIDKKLIDTINWFDTLESLKIKFLDFCNIVSNFYKIFLDKNLPNLVELVKKYMRENYKNEISIKNVAKIFYINSVYLGQIFKKSQGIYFNDYLNLLRIEEAKKLLKMTNFKIYEIAEKVGYSNDVYFINKFVSREGISPSDFRKQFINGKNEI